MSNSPDIERAAQPPMIGRSRMGSKTIATPKMAAGKRAVAVGIAEKEIAQRGGVELKRSVHKRIVAVTAAYVEVPAIHRVERLVVVQGPKSEI